MSEYFESLGSNEKARYVAKLEFVGSTLEDDPYAKESATKFATDMTGCPPVEYGHILPTSLRALAEVYSLEQLLCWKQLEGYNYFQSNYIRTVYVRKVGTGADGLCILKATVNPSQRTPDKANQFKPGYW